MRIFHNVTDAVLFITVAQGLNSVGATEKQLPTLSSVLKHYTVLWRFHAADQIQSTVLESGVLPKSSCLHQNFNLVFQKINQELSLMLYEKSLSNVDKWTPTLNETELKIKVLEKVCSILIPNTHTLNVSHNRYCIIHFYHFKIIYL